MSERERLTQKQISFEIRFALGQAPACFFIGAHSKSPEIQLKALDKLTAHVAVRFEGLTVERELKDGWDKPLCGLP